MPIAPPRPPSAAPRPAGPPAGAAAARRPRWGWLEWFVVLQQFVLPALIFLPGATALRLPMRTLTVGLGLIFWAGIVGLGRRRPGAESFPPLPWLKAASAWLLLSVVHPTTNTPTAGLAQAMLYITFLAPAFWAHSALASPRQCARIVGLIFACNAVSAVLGVGQYYRPEALNPKVAIFEREGNDADFLRAALTIETDDGRKLIRPCGLSDSPGYASVSGAITCLTGLALMVRPGPPGRRLAYLFLAMLGVVAIYFTQVRAMLVMSLICILCLAAIFMRQRRYWQANLLGIALTVVLVAGALWVIRSGGSRLLERFQQLITADKAEIYRKSRGFMVAEAFGQHLFDYPLGAGLGRWGMMHVFFGNHSDPSSPPIWVEVQWPAWIVDGGLPLVVLYAAALGVAMADTLRVALRSRDPELSYWAAVTFALNMSVVALTFSYVPFVMTAGGQFWLLAAVIHAADRRTRAPGRPARPAPGRG